MTDRLKQEVDSTVALATECPGQVEGWTEERIAAELAVCAAATQEVTMKLDRRTLSLRGEGPNEGQLRIHALTNYGPALLELLVLRRTVELLAKRIYCCPLPLGECYVETDAPVQVKEMRRCPLPECAERWAIAAARKEQE